MDAVRVALLREVLAGTEWPGAARRFAGALRGAVEAQGGGLLLVGTEAYEPWHLAAHLDDEAAWSGLRALSPTLVRHRVPPAGPAHLGVGLGRLEAAGRGETLLVVAPGDPGDALLERVGDARRAGAAVLALDGGSAELPGLAHELLTVPGGSDSGGEGEGDGIDMETVQHLVSAAAGENGAPAPTPAASARTGLRARLTRLAEVLSSPPPARW
ncbi:hypothetical protein [Streptomyces sp. MAR4 CNX-425]|uniref:hypothetical protein n=1 Tax=Streptomyces sp. MAR4 CNX-425 TaxID=3406343 RepID=UPI003B509278